MKIIAIGGPFHGKELPYKNGQLVLVMPVVPDPHVADWRGDPLSSTVSTGTATYWRKVVADRLVWEYQGR